MTRSLPFSIALLALLLFVPLRSDAESLMSFHPDRPVRMEADQLEADYGREVFKATGAATLEQEGMTLNADQIWYEKASETGGATGSVRLVEEEGELEGDDLTIDLARQTARLKQARAKLKEQNFRLAGDEIEKLDSNRYHISDGSFTTCIDSPPAWRFGASSVDVEVGGYARAWNMFFYVRDVPVFYLPYFLYPIKTERESGFLVPHIGFSRLRGTELFLSYYQVLGRNMDATFFLDTYSELGLGKGVEYRYIFGRDNEGTANLYHVTASNGGEDLYAARWSHEGTLPGAIRMRADVEHVSSLDYLTLFGAEAKDYNRASTESTLSLSRAWGKTDLSLQANRIQDLTGAPDTTLLPEVRLAVIPQRVAETPLYLLLDLEGENLQQDSHPLGQTLTVRPAARLVFRPWDGISWEGEGGYRTLSSWMEAGATDQRGFYDVATRITARARRYFLPATPTGTTLQHVVEPEVGFEHIQNNGQETFPGLLPEELLLPADRISFALSNRLTARRQPVVGPALIREWASLRLSGQYNLRETSSGEKHLTPIRGEATLRPTDRIALVGDARYDHSKETNRWETVASGIRLSDQRRDELGLDYYFRDSDGLEYLSGRIASPLTDHVNLSYQGRFSLDGEQSLEHLLNLEYHGQCWNVILTVRDRPDEREYLINFGLAGLGSSSGFFGSGSGL